MLTFLTCLVVAAGGLGYIGGALLGRAAGIEQGRDDMRREYEMTARERAATGFTVIDR